MRPRRLILKHRHMPTMIWIMLFLVRILTLRIGHENHVGVQAQLVTDLLSTPKNGSNVNQPLHNGRYPHYHHLYLQSSSTQRLNQIENDDEEEINVKGKLSDQSSLIRKNQ